MTYTPTGKWEVYGEWDSNCERSIPVLVAPDGTVDSRWSTDGDLTARGYADTYNLNDDKAKEFRACPYCVTECSWCERIT